MSRGLLLAAVAVVVAVVACGGAPAKPDKPAPPVARPIPDLGTLAGAWHSTDVDGWSYDLSLTAGKYELIVDRTTGGRCRQAGTIDSYEKAYGQKYVSPEEQRLMYETGGTGYGAAPTGPAPGTVLALVLRLETNDCNPQYQGAELVVLASDFDGQRFTLRTAGGWGAEESHRYQRVVATTERAAK